MTTKRFAAFAACAVAIASVTSGTAFAQQSQGTTKKYVATRDITVDKQTGQLRRPTAEEVAALVTQLTELTNRSSEGLQQVAGSNGVSIDLQGRFQSVILARPAANGTAELRCVTTFEAAAEFLGLVEDAGQR